MPPSGPAACSIWKKARSSNRRLQVSHEIPLARDQERAPQQTADHPDGAERGDRRFSVRVASRGARRLFGGRRSKLVDPHRHPAIDLADFFDADQSRRGDQEHAGRAGRHLGELVRRRLQGLEEFLRAVRHRARELPPDLPGDRADARGEESVPRRPHRLHRRRRAGANLRLQGRRQDHAAGRHPDVRHERLRLHRPRRLPVWRGGSR